MSAYQSIRSVIFDIHNVLVSNDASACFSRYLAEKAKIDPRIDTMWSGDVRTVLYGLLTKYCPLCDYKMCTQYPINDPACHMRKAIDAGQITYEGYKVAMTYMLTHYVQCEPKVRIVLDHAVDFFSRPEMMMQSMKPLKVGVQLFHHIVKKFGRSNVFLLSNFPLEAFSIFKVAFADIYDSIPEQNAVVAGHIGIAKPDPKIFEAMIKRVGGEPSTMVLIDDQMNNIVSARGVGMQALLFSPKPSAELAAWYKEINFTPDK
ncbi:MAG: putative hydrolase of the superfamily [Candidatus Dependentiae bacterium]|nr:putative hydrolase of the superfamily [Candidatus Dependentiae bacterium]